MEARITPAEFEATKAQISKINERAAKRGFTGRLEITGTEVEVNVSQVPNLQVMETVVDVVISGEAPRYNGWEFIARVDSDPAAGLLVNTVPGKDISAETRARLQPGWCDHCKAVRNRNKIYLVTDGEVIKQVGSTCLRDFLGWDGKIVWLDLAGEAKGIVNGFGGGERTWRTEDVLALAWAAVKTFGFVRSGETGATRDVIGAVLSPTSKRDRELARELAPVAAEAAGKAVELRAWLLSDAFAGDGSYVANLKAIAAADVCTYRSIGLLASAPQAWARSQERTLIRQREREAIVSEFVGDVKDKLELNVTVKSIRYIQGNYGVTTLYTLADEAGRLFKWFSSNEGLGDEEGVTLRIRGTVKGHEEYNGTKSTQLTRCKVLS